MRAFAEISAATASTSWLALAAIGAAIAIAINFVMLVRLLTGKQNERQIEPTQLAAIQEELKRQTGTLGEIRQESATTAAHVTNIREEVNRLRDDVRREGENTFRRINAISAESTATKTRVDGIEAREALRVRPA